MNLVKSILVSTCGLVILVACAGNPAADTTAEKSAPTTNCSYEASTGSNIMTHKCKVVDPNAPPDQPFSSMPNHVCTPNKNGTQNC